MKCILLIFFTALSLTSFSQNNHFSLEINYGLAGNHFVNSYIEQGEQRGDEFIPPNLIFLADKHFLGTVSQIQGNYHFKNNTSLTLGYARDSHQRERDYFGQSANNVVSIENWSIRHNNNIFFAKHKRNLGVNLRYHFGVFVIHPEQQEIDIWEFPNGYDVIMDERDFPNNNLSDGGFLGGFDFEKQIDTKFTTGLHLSGFYVASAATYETTYLTGSLAYHFYSKQK